MIQNLLILFVGLLLSASVSFAGGKYNAHFGDMDKNADDLVVKEEFTDYFKANNKPEAAFVLIDADKSGGIDHDEWHNFKKAHGYEHMDGKGHMEGMKGMKSMKGMEGTKHMEGIKQ